MKLGPMFGRSIRKQPMVCCEACRVSRSLRVDVKQLAGYDPAQFRLRLGDYRIRFRKTGDAIQIVRVQHRSEAYR